ncbi:MAG: YdcF family protein [Treponemataceae bacterium]|nr:YdcF family protein [Treponemataceae bacterium]
MNSRTKDIIFTAATAVPAFACNFYFVAMQMLSPATVLGTIFSFSAVWFWLSVLLFAMASAGRAKLKVIAGCIARPVRISAAAVLSLIFAACIVNLILISRPAVSDGAEHPAYIIVLGGGITKDAVISAVVQQRLETASAYAGAHPEARIIVTGGTGPFAPCSEASVLKLALAETGIPPERIYAEEDAADTIENFIFSARLAAEADGTTVADVLASPVAIVTSRFHLARAERIARRIGFTDIYGVPSRIAPIFVPNCYAREMLAYIKLNLRIAFTGKPAPMQAPADDVH